MKTFDGVVGVGEGYKLVGGTLIDIDCITEMKIGGILPGYPCFASLTDCVSATRVEEKKKIRHRRNCRLEKKKRIRGQIGPEQVQRKQS